ncbi:MAG: 50S ribosomal protein L23 [Parcubacteria group bacterium]|jgi:large subunit ribosomal protein L23
MGIFSSKKEESTKDHDAQVGAEAEKKVAPKSEKRSTKKVVVDDVASIAQAYGVIEAPIVTEKSHKMAAMSKFAFRVAKSATKKQVKNIVEKMYKVTVKDVHMVVVKPKRRTVKYDRGYQKLYKKAIVTVAKGQHIAVFESV